MRLYVFQRCLLRMIGRLRQAISKELQGTRGELFCDFGELVQGQTLAPHLSDPDSGLATSALAHLAC